MANQVTSKKALPSPESEVPNAGAESEPPMLAAIDLGSNSFRMVIARVVGQELQLIDRLRDGVRLAAYLDPRRRLTAEGEQRALECLQKFGQRIRHLPSDCVRAVGTNTLRKARKTGKFLEHARLALGHPIEVVSGQEEARLIYLGAAHSLAVGDTRRLVLDIGGGSTELALGEGFEPQVTESLYMGCVGFSLKYFPEGKIKPSFMRRAETAARLELEPVKAAFLERGWEAAVGTSGTLHAIRQLALENGWSEQGITLSALNQLRDVVLEAQHVDALDLPGLRRERARVLPGGLAILRALFDTFDFERVDVASGAMREGVLYDLIGRIRFEDMRERTITRFVQQYNVDQAQAGRVEATALELLEGVAEAWDLDLKRASLFLSWAARLHEIGLAVAHSGYHKHGAYLVESSDMAGFSLQDQRVLSLMIRNHRRKLHPELFSEGLPAGRAKRALRLCLVFRLAVLLNRSRSPRPLPQVRLEADRKGLELQLPSSWLDAHPLTRADLQLEARRLQATGLKLRFGV